MNWDAFIDSKLVTDLGWTLLNSVWQIAGVSGVLWLVLRFFRGRSSNLRYAVSVSALALAVTLPVITFVQLSANRSAATLDDHARERILRERLSGMELTGQGAMADASPESIAATNNSNTSALFVDLQKFLDNRLPDILPFAVGLWLIGVALLSLRLAGGIWQLKCYKTLGIEPVQKHWKREFEHLCSDLVIVNRIRLFSSTIVQTPIAIGIFKPVIIIPASLFLQISPRELEVIIAHELIHIRRYDPLVNAIQSGLEVIFFYHPAIWWISAVIRREREFAADAAVMSIFEDSHVTYARALANIEEIRLRADQQMPRLATAANGGNLMQRIQRILKIKTEVNRANSAWTAGLAVLLTSAVLLAVFSFNSSNYVNAQSKSAGSKLAIGFVSIPPLDRTDNAPKDADATARLLIHALKKYKVPATGFLQGGMISDGEKFFPVRREIARMWIDAGFEVGLGGFKHISLHNTPVDEYIANIEKNETVAKKLLGEMGLPPRYFSYPYLNAGKSADDKAKVEAWLNQRGYTSVKYTIDNQEWMYSFAYDMARNDNDVKTMKEIREAYLDYIEKMFEHYEAYSAEMFGRDIAQTMVLTPSRLITDTADEFFAMAKKRGYKFISVDEAQSDPAYKTAENFAGEAGISWFERWTMAKGGKLRDEPAVNSAVLRSWEARSKK